MALVLDTFQVSYHDAPLFEPVSLQALPGETTTIMGPSGCGKSTLLAAICGTLDPGFNHSGDITLNGRSLAGVPVQHRRVGILFQDDLLFPHLDVYGNMAFGLPAGMNRAERADRIRESLEMAGLGGFEKRDIATLSGGQKARVSLLRSMLAEPEAILLDEPFSKLDAELRSAIRDFVFSLIGRLQIPALLVTHDRSDAPGGQFLELVQRAT